MTMPLYAAFLACLYIFLTVKIIRLRRSLKIAIGDGGNMQMIRAIRAHSNFSEYTPLALVLIFLVENLAGPLVLVHGLGICFCIGRISHALGISRLKENFNFRVFGMAMTLFTLATSAGFIFLSILMRTKTL